MKDKDPVEFPVDHEIVRQGDQPDKRGPMSAHPRVLIEDWLPAAAIGVECMRERGSASALAPHSYLHVWWARRPLTAARAAVLGSLLPADFPREVFERLLGFWGSSQSILKAQQVLDWAKVSGVRVRNPHGARAFKRGLQEGDLKRAHQAAARLWGPEIAVVDPMAGGGSIPLESARLGFHTLANEYNPVACSVLEATVDYPFRYGEDLAAKAREWGTELRRRFNTRMERYYPKAGLLPRYCYIFARTVPCPDTQHNTPLVPNWHLLKPKSGRVIAAEPLVDQGKGAWTVRIREVGRYAGQLREPPQPTYRKGTGISIFTGRSISPEYIKAMAQQGKMQRTLYAVVTRTQKGLEFQLPEPLDLKALGEAERELAQLRPGWEKGNVIPTEKVPVGDKTGDLWGDGTDMPLKRGERYWVDMFSPRQLLCFGVLVEELRRLRLEVVKAEGEGMGEAVVHLLALVIDKMTNYNSGASFWHAIRQTMANTFDRHDFSFKATNAEMAPCDAGAGLGWAIDNVLEAYEGISKLPRPQESKPVEISLGSATTLPQLADGSITAVVVDPPYADNVQYSELADFFYVWLKRTQGHRRPEWFSTYLCEHDQEAVVNISRHREDGDRPTRRGKRDGSTGEARAKAHAFYQGLMLNVFRESRRILRNDGVLTVMFTHKKQEAWEALFTSLIQAGFTITATWPIKTESEHSLHQARKNAAQSTVLLVARKRPGGAGVGYFDQAMQQEIRERARTTAERLQQEGLNPVDQLVGSFGPAMEVYSRYDEVRTDTGELVGVDRAIDQASEAVSLWREEQLAARGLEGVEAEGRFVLLCWDVLGAAEFRFNEAHLLGKAVGMDVDQLVVAGLVTKSGDKVQMLAAKERRRERALEPEEMEETFFGPVVKPRRSTKKQALKVHPNDSRFRTALDACHALALRHLEEKTDAGGIGSAKALVRQQRWTKESPVARLMEALVHAAPEALWHEQGARSAAVKFPEFRAWHALLEPLFGIEPPEWKKEAPPLELQFQEFVEEEEGDDVENEEEEGEEVGGEGAPDA
jgi:adenine-specific DNA methylase